MNTRAVKTHYNIPALSVTFDPKHVTMYVPDDDEGTYREWRCETKAMNELSGRGAAG